MVLSPGNGEWEVQQGGSTIQLSSRGDLLRSVPNVMLGHLEFDFFRLDFHQLLLIKVITHGALEQNALKEW